MIQFYHFSVRKMFLLSILLEFNRLRCCFWSILLFLLGLIGIIIPQQGNANLNHKRGYNIIAFKLAK